MEGAQHKRMGLISALLSLKLFLFHRQHPHHSHGHENQEIPKKEQEQAFASECDLLRSSSKKYIQRNPLIVASYDIRHRRPLIKPPSGRQRFSQGKDREVDR